MYLRKDSTGSTKSITAYPNWSHPSFEANPKMEGPRTSHDFRGIDFSWIQNYCRNSITFMFFWSRQLVTIIPLSVIRWYDTRSNYFALWIPTRHSVEDTPLTTCYSFRSQMRKISGGSSCSAIRLITTTSHFLNPQHVHTSIIQI